MERMQQATLLAMKRKVYLVLFPVLCLVNLSYWLSSPFVDGFLTIALPISCILLAVATLAVYYERGILLIEWSTLLLFGIYHLCRFYSLVQEAQNGALNVYAFWSTIYFVFVFFVLRRQHAFVFSVGILAVSLLIGIRFMGDVRVNDILMQYYISTGIYIVILYYFQQAVAGYIETDMLKQHAYVDHLTRLGNRRAVDDWLAAEIALAQQTGRSFAVIYFDIDHFKRINDTYGHACGDRVLQQLAQLLLAQRKAPLRAGHWGGEEFIVVAPAATLQQAAAQAEALRHTIATHAFDEVQQLTCSFGVASFVPHDNAASLLKRADAALYTAKHHGRNRVCLQGEG